MPVAVFTVGCLFKTDKFNWSTMLNMMLVTMGVAIASYGACGEAQVFAAAGNTFHMVGISLARPHQQWVAHCCWLSSVRQHVCYPSCHPGELNFNIVGAVFQLGSIFSESIRLVMVQILLQVR